MAKETAGSVSAQLMADHLAMSRTYLDRLVSSGVIKRRDDGRFDLDRCRVDYLRHLRQAKRVSPNGEARAALDKARAREAELRVAKIEGQLMETDDAIAVTDELVGLFLTGLSGLPAQCSRDMQVRRTIEASVRDMRQRIADKARQRVKELTA